MEKTYRVAEDSLLLLSHAKKLVEGLALDMGTGSGLISIEIALKPEVSRVVSLDINPNSLTDARRNAKREGVLNKIDFLIGDLFRALYNCKFDWIVFNPPYLPSEGKMDELSWTGGKKGVETIRNFLFEAVNYLDEKGGMIIVFSSLSHFKFEDFHSLYSITLLEELSIFFEKLYCVLLRPQPFFNPK
jgi:HemK-related putative methylase